MIRLLCLVGAPASVLVGVAAGQAFEWSVVQSLRRFVRPPSAEELRWPRVIGNYNSYFLRFLRIVGGCYVITRYVWPTWNSYREESFNRVIHGMSNPEIIFWEDHQKIDDYMKAYNWLRDSTSADARVMAWWDYGYQISGIANRTTLCDGNTWNMEHIGLVGLCLSSPIEEAHQIVRHLADYVLVWATTDMDKSSLFSDISNAVFRGHCGEDDCEIWGVKRDGSPTAMYRESLIFHLCAKDSRDGTFRNSEFFEEVFLSSRGRVRIVKVLNVSKKSKDWLADPGNRVCDAPGSWYCPGVYPPVLRQMLGHDNVTDPEAVAYRKAYTARLRRQADDAPKPNGLDLPKGSYLQSCRGCQTRVGQHSDALDLFYRTSADRKLGLKLSGGEVVSVLDDGLLAGWNAQHPTRQITRGTKLLEVNGVRRPELMRTALRNRGGMYLRFELAPRESIILSCTHCKQPGSPSDISELSLTACPEPLSIDNLGGFLTCKAKPNERDIPEGPYQGSCEGCLVESRGDTTFLICSSCDTMEGQRHMATYDLSRCASPGLLDNQNGQLKCLNLPNANDIPPGAYSNSCTGCAMDGATRIVCSHCGTADGRQIVATLDLTTCLGSEVDNADGTLVCKEPVNLGLPLGDYRKSCTACQMHGQQLRCQGCTDGDGNALQAVYYPARCPQPGQLDNMNGVLICVGLPSESILPDGGYLESCEGCRIHDKHLSCSSCLAADGTHTPASGDFSECLPPSTLDNDNGQLVCSFRNPPWPIGDYHGSCVSCRLVDTDTRFECRCRSANGMSHVSSYIVHRCPAIGHLTNDNGILTCVGLRNGDGVPEGDYLDSCQGCSLDNMDMTLVCSHCRTSNGQQRTSSISLRDCFKTGEKLVNQDGRLHCQSSEGT